MYKLLQKYKNDYTKLTLRLTSDHISFETPVGYLRYGCDHYTFCVKVSEISLFEYFIFGHLIWGNGLTIKDVLIGDLVHITKFVKIYSWQARRIRNILQAGDNYSAVLLLTEPNKVTQIICLKQRASPRQQKPEMRFYRQAHRALTLIMTSCLYIQTYRHNVIRRSFIFCMCRECTGQIS